MEGKHLKVFHLNLFPINEVPSTIINDISTVLGELKDVEALSLVLCGWEGIKPDDCFTLAEPFSHLKRLKKLDLKFNGAHLA